MADIQAAELGERISKTRALLFDFDGVLMRSIEDHYRSWNDAFGVYGVQIGWEEFAVLEGQSLVIIAEQLAIRHGLSIEASRVIARAKNERYLSTAALALYDDVGDTLDFFSVHGFALALVTGAHRDRLDRSVDAAFRARFGSIVTADDVQRTKPDPEPFVKAAQHLGVPPEACMVIENAPLGIESARRAGMMCIALTTTLSERHLQEADMIIGSLRQLVALFQNGEGAS